MSSSRDYISTSLISEKINLFDKEGLTFGFNNLKEGDFLSAAPVDHGVLRDIGKIKPQRKAALVQKNLPENL